MSRIACTSYPEQMHAGAGRTVLATVLVVGLSIGTLWSAVTASSRIAADGLGAATAGVAALAVVLLLALLGSLLLLRSGLRRRRAAPAPRDVVEEVVDGSVRRLELAREHPEERWTSLPLDEEPVARWLATRAFAEEDGTAVTAEGLRRSDESERTGSTRTLVHRYGYVRVTVLSSFSRLRGLGIELLVDDPGIRSEVVADLQGLAEELGGLTLRAAAPEPEPEQEPEQEPVATTA